jgi:hypothetical protein
MSAEQEVFIITVRSRDTLMGLLAHVLPEATCPASHPGIQ